MNKINAEKLLVDVTSTLQHMNLTNFLVDGTLLGAVREKEFIDHDEDIDVGTFAEEWNPELVGKFVSYCLSLGIIPAHMFGEPTKYFEIALKRDGVKCDLFFYRKDGDKRIFHAFLNGGRTLPDDVITYEYPAELFDKLSIVTLRDIPFLAPANAEAVLEAKYGDWRTPVKKWDWAFGPKNVRR